MQKMTATTKVVLAVALVIILGLAAVAIGPVVYTLAMGGGVKTEGINEQQVQPAVTDVNGEWTVTTRAGHNSTSTGFTFDEVLPGERTSTSGSTQDVSGGVVIENETLSEGEIEVGMGNIVTDRDNRDVNVRMKILHTDTFPVATFKVTEPADLSGLPEDGSVGQVELTGDMTIHGQTNSITQMFDVARDGNNLVVAGDIPINRLDYGVESPEFVAAKIAEEGEVNVRLNLIRAE